MIINNDVIHDLLAPINEQAPTGIDIRTDNNNSKYFKLKNLRRKARELERKNRTNEVFENPLPLWKDCSLLASSMLKEDTKDLEIMCWLIEAETRCNNTIGLYQSISTFNSLLKNYWPGLHPIDRLTQQSSLQSFINLNGENKPGYLIDAINQIPLITSSERSYTCGYISYALEQNNADELSTISIECNKLNSDSSLKLLTYAEMAQEEYQQSIELIDKCSAMNSTPTSYIKNSLERLITAIKYVLSQHKHTEIPFIESSELENNNEPAENINEPSYPNPLQITNRCEAEKSIRQVISYFEHYEPHSPILLLLKRSLKWAEMSFYELINEMVSDEKAKESIFNITGIQ